MLPSEFLNLPKHEKAFLIASIQLKLEHDKKESDKIKSRKR